MKGKTTIKTQRPLVALTLLVAFCASPVFAQTSIDTRIGKLDQAWFSYFRLYGPTEAHF